MSEYPHSNVADQYARDCASGKILTNKWVRLACQRHLDDLKRQKNKDYPYYFDSEAADWAVRFIELMPHTKGKWAAKRELLNLQPWQKFFVCSLFGWKRKKNKTRRFRKADLFVPRKNGKSALAAAIGVLMFVGDGEYGAEVYSGATTQDQAWEVFRPARLMCKNNPSEFFHSTYGIEVNASNLCVPDDMSRFEPLIGDPGDGSSPHCAIVDEYHEHKDDRLYDTMLTGMGAREQPIILNITTAGDNISGPCYARQNEIQRMLDGLVQDDETFALIYGIDEGDPWDSVDSLKKANPNFGVSVGEDFLLARLNEARNNARKQSIYKTKHLNVWVGSRDAYYNVEMWNSLSDPLLDLYQFRGQKIYIGLDLASRVDIAALEILIPREDGTYIQFGKHYLPEDTATQEHYVGWMRDGYLTVTDGNSIDFHEIKSDILQLCADFEVIELVFDPFQATMLITELMNEGVNVVELRATVLNFSEPMKELDSLIRKGKIKHNGDPCFAWMLSNVTAKADRKDNVFPTKERDENKIDGPVALMMALNRAIQGEDRSLELAINSPLGVTY